MASGYGATQPMVPWRVMSHELHLLGKQPIDVRFNGSVILLHQPRPKTPAMIQRYRRVGHVTPLNADKKLGLQRIRFYLSISLLVI